MFLWVPKLITNSLHKNTKKKTAQTVTGSCNATNFTAKTTAIKNQIQHKRRNHSVLAVGNLYKEDN